MPIYPVGTSFQDLHALGARTARALPDGTIEADVSATLGQVASVALDRVRKIQRAEVVSSRNATITGGFTYLGKQIDSDRDSVMAITGAATAALAAKATSLPYSVVWTCADDSTLTLDADGVLGMVVTLAMFADAQHAKARPLKEAIAVEKDPEKIKQMKW